MRTENTGSTGKTFRFTRVSSAAIHKLPLNLKGWEDSAPHSHSAENVKCKR